MTAPALLSPTASSTTALDDLVLEWSPVAQAVKYRLELLSDDGLTTVHKADLVGTQYAPPVGLTAGQYLWQVTALVGDSATIELARSERRALTVTTLPGVAGSAKTTAQPAAGTLSVSWSQDAGGGLPVTRYVLRYRAGEDSWAEQMLSSDNRGDRRGRQQVGTSYTLQVAAANGNGLGPWSAVMTAKTATVPGAVSSIGVSSVTSGLKVPWRTPSSNGGVPLTGYRVEVRPAGTGDAPWVGTDLAVTTNTTLNQLSPSSRYEVRAAARNGVGLGPWSQYLTAVAPRAPVTPTPRPVKPTSPPAPTPAPKAASSVTLVASSRSGAVGRSVTLTAKVTPSTAKGSVRFADSGHILGSATISGGRAVLVTKGIYGGSQSLVARYGGSAFVVPSQSAPLKVSSTDRTKPKLSKVKVSGRAATPTVTWTGKDTGGLRYAQVKTKYKGGKTRTVRLPASPASWKASSAKKGTFCAWVKSRTGRGIGARRRSTARSSGMPSSVVGQQARVGVRSWKLQASGRTEPAGGRLQDLAPTTRPLLNDQWSPRSRVRADEWRQHQCVQPIR